MKYDNDAAQRQRDRPVPGGAPIAKFNCTGEFIERGLLFGVRCAECVNVSFECSNLCPKRVGFDFGGNTKALLILQTRFTYREFSTKPFAFTNTGSFPRGCARRQELF
ncbi:MAG: hypothetical protein AUF76_02345 [Acidobacteria bacterium 13_1_20CM_2_65_9]|nr:MAG: hypothetical protein AUF76_02345 [Acidobacteria bacterium 13_1_20CM_2_65_9]